MKKFIALSLCLVTMLTLFALPASAAAVYEWPSLSENCYAEFYAIETIPVYRDSACTVRGSSSPAQSYNAEIWYGDTCRIIEATSSYLKVKYPTSSGMRTGYIKREVLCGMPEPFKCKWTAGCSVPVYADENGTYYGKTAKGDVVYLMDKVRSNGNITYNLIMYSAVSGSRGWKIGYVTIVDLDKMVLG